MDKREELLQNYIPKEDRKKILLIADDIRSNSGVSTVSREIILNTGHYYNWVQIAGAITHPDKGTVFDFSQEINKTLGINDGYLKAYPTDGYGTPELLRALIEEEKPDAVMLFTDPRYFIWVFQMEKEIRSKIPIIYLNIWDNLPIPYYNKPYYESCDLLLGISKQTKYINDKVLGSDKGDIITKYLPHGLNNEEIYPIKDKDDGLEYFRNKLFGEDEIDFTVFFNSRNVKRKQIPDVILAWRLFLDRNMEEYSKKSRLILHTEKVSNNGTDLGAVVDVLLGEKYRKTVIIHEENSTRKELNYLYNIADVQILISSNEGWGLSITEALLSGTPFIANVTGGIQDQMRFVDVNDKWYIPCDEVPSNNKRFYNKCGEWAIPIFPNNISLQGAPTTPYIFDDRCNPEDVSKKLLSLSYLSRDKLKEMGEKGRVWAISDEAGFTSKHQALRFIEYTNELFNKWSPKNKMEVTNVNDYNNDFFIKNIDY